MLESDFQSAKAVFDGALSSVALKRQMINAAPIEIERRGAGRRLFGRKRLSLRQAIEIRIGTIVIGILELKKRGHGKRNRRLFVARQKNPVFADPADGEIENPGPAFDEMFRRANLKAES